MPKPNSFSFRRSFIPLEVRPPARGGTASAAGGGLLLTGFTLLELLLVIGIIAILSVVAILLINPAELLKRSRDSQRISNLATINRALNLFQVDNTAGFLGTASTTYVSIPDLAAPLAGSNCAGMGLPALPAGYSYHCAASSTYRNTDATGWIPINFTQVSSGSPLSILPIDPINTTSSGNYYAYTPGGSWELDAYLESAKYYVKQGQDGGDNHSIFEIGNNLALSPQIPRVSMHTSCVAINNVFPDVSNGNYMISPDGSLSSSFLAYCDMAGGGWTLVVRAANTGDNNLNTLNAYNGVPSPTGPSAKISHSDIQALVNASILNNPIKMDFADIGVADYVWRQCSWTSSADRNKCASWATTADAATHVTRCGNSENPNLNNGNGGEWASDAIPWPYQDGSCSQNGGFATVPNACGLGNGDAWCNGATWQPQTGIGASGRFKVNIWVK